MPPVTALPNKFSFCKVTVLPCYPTTRVSTSSSATRLTSVEIATLQPEVRSFDPHATLDGGADGLNFHRLIASRAAAFLKPTGKVMLEFGDGQAEAVRKIFENEKWVVERVEQDYSHQPRILVARR
jgi:release factor glutamine methyltransferase